MAFLCLFYHLQKIIEQGLLLDGNDFLNRGYAPFLDLALCNALDERKLPELPRCDERNGQTFLARSSGSADPVDVGLRVLGKAVVDHMRQLRNIDSSCSNVRGNQNADPMLPHLVHDQLALCLRQVPVQHLGVITVGDELRAYLVALELGPAENQTVEIRIHIDCPAENLELVLFIQLVEYLLGEATGHILRLHSYQLIVLHEARCQLENRIGHGGRKAQRLAVLGNLRKDILDVLDEAHVQHFVGLVQHTDLDCAQIQCPALHVVLNPSRGSHNDIHTGLEVPELNVIRRSAIDRCRPDRPA